MPAGAPDLRGRRDCASAGAARRQRNTEMPIAATAAIASARAGSCRSRLDPADQVVEDEGRQISSALICAGSLP
jgi:hypothetical protein